MKIICLHICLLLFTLACAPAPGQAEMAPERVLIAPSHFDISEAELEASLQKLPGEIRQNILDDPQGFLVLMSQVLEYDPETFILADKQHFLSADHVPDDLVSLNSFPLARTRNDLRLRSLIMPDVLAMNQAASAAGLRLVFGSSYRSYQYQAEVYDRYVRQFGQQQADRFSARPGSSQHQLGTVIDFAPIGRAFDDTPEAAWLSRNAWRFGFSLSYPEGYEELTGYMYESWHYRWLGRPAAHLSYFYFNDIQHHFLYYLDEHLPWFTLRRID